MSAYTFEDLTLEVRPSELAASLQLARLLSNLSWVPATGLHTAVGVRLLIRIHDRRCGIRPQGRVVFRTTSFSGFEHGQAFTVSDGRSALHLQPHRHMADAYVDSSFVGKPLSLQFAFWSFAVLKLIRAVGYYSLHAAGVVSPQGRGVLIVGPSEIGKSTLALGLMRKGWQYLSDDAVLVRRQGDGIRALALRRHFYLNASDVSLYGHLPFGPAIDDHAGRTKRRLCLEAAFPGQAVSATTPALLLFPRISSREHTALHPLLKIEAARRLLEAAGSQLCDRATIGAELQVFRDLVGQAAALELHAGRDVHREPAVLIRLLDACTVGEATWHALSSS
jgi:hypothetical protein